MTRLSVNINKIATLRNARGGNQPDVLEAALRIQSFGANGITVHPREDERHIRYQDVCDLRELITTELNIEGYPSEKWMKLVSSVKPEQATLVPDNPGQLTSDHGWDTISNRDFLKDVIARLKESGCRVSLFIDPVPALIEAAAYTGADRIELYTGPYAHNYQKGREAAVSPFSHAAEIARSSGLGVNAGHDLNLDNLNYFLVSVPDVEEVSIGHALISDALYLGLEKAVKEYLRQIPGS